MAVDRQDNHVANLLVEAARLHGENSEPEHEVGDLQDLFFACWLVMSPNQHALALSDPAVLRLFEIPEYDQVMNFYKGELG